MTPAIADAWRAILLRRPTWRAEAEFRAEYEAGGRPDDRIAALGAAEAGRGRDRPRRGGRAARRIRPPPTVPWRSRAATAPPIPLEVALGSIPAYWLIARRYRRRAAR